MSLFDRLFGGRKPPKVSSEYFKLLDGYTPRFSTWSGSIYESELVRSAIDARARHMSKLDVALTGAAKPALQRKLKTAPNEWQTWSQFFYRMSTILDMENNVIISPVYDMYGAISGIYPLLSKSRELVTYNGEVWIRLTFFNDKKAALPLREVGIMTKHQFKNDFFGSSNSALDRTMDLVEIQNQGIKEATKQSASFRFMATLSNLSSDEDLTKTRDRFNRENLESGGGLLLFPTTFKDVKQVESKPYVVDAEQMKLIQTNVYNYFGVNEDVLQNKAIGDAWSAFYEGAIEPVSIQFSEVVTKMLFTERERTEGNGIMATSNRLQYMSNKDKLDVSAQMADRGLMSRNEIRQIWNLPPLPAEIGNTFPVRGEYYNLGATNE